MNIARCLILLAASTTAWATAAPRHDPAADRLLSDAIEAAGGQQALSTAPVLAWTGNARIYSDKKIIAITVDTVVEPPVRARSRSWLTKIGPGAVRTLEIDASGGTMTREGLRSPMPPPMLLHERQQYAIYELLRLTPLQRADVRLTLLPKGRGGLRGVRVRRPDLPDADLWFDTRRRLVVVKTIVTDPEAGTPIREEVRLFGRIEDRGVRWPKRINILWNGAPYFELTLSSFSARGRFD